MVSRDRQPIIAMGLLIILMVVGGYFLFGYTSAAESKPAVIDYTVQMSIQVENNNSSALRFFVPPPIGVAGGAWATHVFDKYGVKGNYPVYQDSPPLNYPGYSIIHVRSNIDYNYTLGDFFAVWGYPIGPSQTLNLVSHPPDKATWSMCVGSSQNSLRPGHWGAELLRSDTPIILIYGKTGCA